MVKQVSNNHEHPGRFLEANFVIGFDHSERTARVTCLVYRKCEGNRVHGDTSLGKQLCKLGFIFRQCLKIDNRTDK